MAGPATKSVVPEEGKKKARIEIIPLIDVIFFLLATFVLFTLSLNKIQSVPVNLPVASTASSSKSDDDTVTLQISDQGTCYWNKELINLSEIRPRLAHYKTQVAVPRVLIAGDDKAKFGITVQALDEVRKADIQQVSVETRVRPTGR
ncbi:ExbD/TolR family protein [Opitutus terrae]|uniref:Biopolymer transport protein ExbD/TolR n=1 Tax=Opitutus terrae (strain DSM 11246 / JCM 15787 / PB90-1) TaxID=452637 RepID=B1ZQL8_OPITP|nr:biopolymer transporter ExbD [Opitutus terrae]ACB75627.1 Biopolymer transport protein ExbD/TolR [Opitutus terrae PB90-1]